jgi:hypothetical protein
MTPLYSPKRVRKCKSDLKKKFSSRPDVSGLHRSTFQLLRFASRINGLLNAVDSYKLCRTHFLFNPLVQHETANLARFCDLRPAFRLREKHLQTYFTHASLSLKNLNFTFHRCVKRLQRLLKIFNKRVY